MSLRTLRGGTIVALLAIIAAACGASTTQSATNAPATAAPPATSAPAASAPAASPSAAAAADPEDLLFKYEYKPAAGTPGGTIVLGEWQPPSTLNNYYNNSGAIQEVLAETMRGLWVTTSDGHWKPDLVTKMPKFSDKSVRLTSGADVAQCPPKKTAAGASPAASAAASTAGFEFDIELTPGLKWSDGQPLTTKDIKYTWQWNMDPAQSGLIAGTTGWEDIADIVVTDDTKATIKFCRPYAGFYGLFSTFMLPEHYFSTIPVKDAAKKSMPMTADIAKLPTSGPFMFETAAPSGITMKKNPNYKGGAAGQGAYLDSIKWSYYKDVDGMKAAFLAGDLDLASNMVQADYDSIKGVSKDIGTAVAAPAWEYEHLDLFQGTPRTPLGHGSGQAILQDVAARKAIVQAIDKAGIFSTLFPGAPLPEKLGCAPAPPGLYFRDETIKCPEFNVEAAKAALAAAGWKDSNGDGTIDKDGKEAVLEGCTTAGRPVRQLTMEKVAQYLKAVGIQMNLTYVDAVGVMFAGYNEGKDAKCSIYGGNYDVALYTSQFTFDLFGDYYYSYHSKQNPDLGDHGGGNTLRFSNPEMDAALDTIKNSLVTADQITAAQKVQQLDVDQVGDIGLYYRQSVRGLSNQLQNFFKNPASVSDMWNAEDWFSKQ